MSGNCVQLFNLPYPQNPLQFWLGFASLHCEFACCAAGKCFSSFLGEGIIHGAYQ